MSTLKIALLGPPEVFHSDRRLLFSDRKTLALLAYLATEDGMHERQHLSRLLWPESDAEHGRTALRITLHRLRRILEEGVGPEHENHLLVLHDALGLNRNSDLEIDMHELQAVWSMARDQRVREAAQGEARRSLIARLEEAAARYRSGFLENFTLHDTVDFDNWVSLQRGYWYQRIERVLDWLSQLQSAEGHIEQAIVTIERWRSLDPLNENISQRLMQFQFATGNRVAALKTYENYQDILQRELGANPSAHMVAQAEFFRHATAPRRPRPREAMQSPAPPARSLLEIPFVGRAFQFHQLLSLYEKAASGQPQVIVLEGEAGIGKTRLATAFLEWAKGQGAEVLEGRASKSHQHLAYQPILDPLRTRFEREQDHLFLVSKTWLAELSRLLPELRERYPDLPVPTTDEASEATRFFEAIARLGEAYAARAPQIIVIDDLQWIDQATLDLFLYLLRRWKEHAAPVLVLLSRRVERRSLDPWLGDWFVSVKRDVPVTRMELGALTEQDLLQIAHAVWGQDHQSSREQAAQPASDCSAPLVRPEESEANVERFGKWLYTQTKGQPFFVGATLEALLERGGLVPHFTGDGWVLEPRISLIEVASSDVTLPSGGREMIQLRLAQLSPQARELLVAAAVLDHDFTFEALCQVAQLPLQNGLFALDEAIEHLLLQEVSPQSGKMQPMGYRFVHEKFHEEVYAEAGDARRRLFHRRALQMLEQEGANAALLAYHAIASGSADLAFRWSIAAGNEAMDVFATRDALGHYEQASLLLEEIKGDIPTTTLHHLYSQLGRAYNIRNDVRAERAIYQTMLETARCRQDAAMECTALNRLAVLEGEDPSRLAHALALLQQAQEVAERTHDQAGLAETYWSFTRVNYYALKLDACLVYGRQAYALIRELGKPNFVMKALSGLSYVMKALGQWEEAASLAEETWHLAVQQGDRLMEADGLSQLADRYINIGQPREGIRAARTAYATSLELEYTWGQATSGYMLARGLVETGAYEEALAVVRQSIDVARTLAFSVPLIVNLLTCGSVYQALLLPEEAKRFYEEALTLAESRSAQRYVAMSASLLCAVAVFTEDWEMASIYARRVQMAREHDEVIFAEMPRWAEIAALLHAGEEEQAKEDLKHFREHFGTNKRCSLALARGQAVLAQWQGKSEQALGYIQTAIAEAKAIGLPGEEWQALVALGKLHLARREGGPAEDVFMQAASIMKQLADTITNDELREHFRAQTRLILGQSTDSLHTEEKN